MRTFIFLVATVLFLVPATLELTEGGFHVEGTKLLDANGNEFMMRGINHEYTWFKDQTNIALPAIAKTTANVIRLVIADGGQWQKDPKEDIIKLIEQCKQLKMIVILEVHDHTGKETIDELMQAVSYYVEIKDALIGQEAYVIVNIANEWIGKWESQIWSEGYKNALTILRMEGIKNTILIDTAGWGQYPQAIVDKGREVFEADTLRNTMFATHMYGSAGGKEKQVRENIDKVLATGLCNIIGEFGWKHSDGDVAEEAIMQYTTEKQMGYLAWSWKGNSGGVEYLDMSNDWEGNNLSDWGKEVVDGPNGLKETSKVCSVFE